MFDLNWIFIPVGRKYVQVSMLHGIQMIQKILELTTSEFILVKIVRCKIPIKFWIHWLIKPFSQTFFMNQKHIAFSQFSVAELAKCRITLRWWMKLTPDRFWMGTHLQLAPIRMALPFLSISQPRLHQIQISLRPSCRGGPEDSKTPPTCNVWIILSQVMAI